MLRSIYSLELRNNQHWVVSSHICPDRYSAKIPSGTLQILGERSPCSSSLPTCSDLRTVATLFFSAFSSVSSIWGFMSLELPSLCHFLETLKTISRAIMRFTSLASHLSEITVLHSLMSGVLKIIVPCILSEFDGCCCFRKEGTSSPS